MTSPAVSTVASAAPVQWSTLIGHDKIKCWFEAAIRRGRLSGSFLFVGAPGIGKRTVAELVARTLLCERVDPAEMAPCGLCDACVQVQAGTHPDVVRVSKPDDKSSIPLDLLIGPPDARMQQGFCRDVRIRPLRGRRKVAVLEDADFLNEEGANALLKTLEEPPSGCIVMLIGTSEQKQLPTIRSRCRIIRMGPLSPGDATSLIKNVHQVDQSESQIAEAVEIAGGDVTAALRLLNESANEIRSTLTKQLHGDLPDPLAISRIIGAYVDQAGKEPSKRRAALRDVFALSVQSFRSQLRREAFQGNAAAETLARLDRCVRALREVDRSANQSTLIDCFAADIAAGNTGDRGGIG